ncbi:hypothetical protein PGQ11_003164 [Apiospora arundinis]|uniref:Secreted protein n=1 Tax=Apiospora arundinis TaxID=335852 RepID=A0ABR2J5R3_9PEZI
MKNLLSKLAASAFAVGISAVPSPIGTDMANEAITNATGFKIRDQDPRGPLCDIPGYTTVLVSKVDESIKKLHAMSGDCTAGAGPGTCARVACTNGGAVWMCNDNTASSSVPCSLLGDYAQAIVDKCKKKDGANHKIVQGQLFDVGPDGTGWGNDPRGPLCNIPDYTRARKGWTHDAIQELRDRKDSSGNPAQCSAGAGPGRCDIAACQRHAAIWFCNDNTSPSTVACNTLADYAQAIYDKCSYTWHKHHWTQGQLFDVGPDGTGWGNVIVGYHKC